MPLLCITIHSPTPNPHTPTAQNPNDKRKKPLEVMDFPTYDAAKALFALFDVPLKERIVVST